MSKKAKSKRRYLRRFFMECLGNIWMNSKNKKSCEKKGKVI